MLARLFDASILNHRSALAPCIATGTDAQGTPASRATAVQTGSPSKFMLHAKIDTRTQARSAHISEGRMMIIAQIRTDPPSASTPENAINHAAESTRLGSS